MKKKSNLTTQEMEFIREREKGLLETLNTLKNLSQFKEGDFLIAFHYARGWGDNKKRQVMNSYGAPKKFVVVMVDTNGVPYMKEINKRGTPVGDIISSVRVDNGYGSIKHAEYVFEVDPDYADAIIMDDEANYDAAVIHKAKADLFKEITEHNKSLKVNCNDQKELIQFLKSLKVGDVVYKSIKTHFTILSIDPIPTSHNNTRLADYKPFGSAQTSKGKIFSLDAHTFRYSAIYKGRPRSYNELKDLK